MDSCTGYDLVLAYLLLTGCWARVHVVLKDNISLKSFLCLCFILWRILFGLLATRKPGPTHMERIQVDYLCSTPSPTPASLVTPSPTPASLVTSNIQSFSRPQTLCPYQVWWVPWALAHLHPLTSTDIAHEANSVDQLSLRTPSWYVPQLPSWVPIHI